MREEEAHAHKQRNMELESTEAAAAAATEQRVVFGSSSTHNAAVNALDVLPGACLVQIGDCLPALTRRAVCSASRELAERLFIFPLKCTLRLPRDGKGAQQAGRAVLLSASTRLECLTVLPAGYGAGEFRFGRTDTPRRLHALFAALKRHRPELTRQMHTLTLKGYRVDAKVMRLVSAAMPSLRTLTLSRCRLEQGAFEGIATHLPDLHELHVDKCPVTYQVPINYTTSEDDEAEPPAAAEPAAAAGEEPHAGDGNQDAEEGQEGQGASAAGGAEQVSAGSSGSTAPGASAHAGAGGPSGSGGQPEQSRQGPAAGEVEEGLQHAAAAEQDAPVRGGEGGEAEPSTRVEQEGQGGTGEAGKVGPEEKQEEEGGGGTPVGHASSSSSSDAEEEEEEEDGESSSDEEDWDDYIDVDVMEDLDCLGGMKLRALTLIQTPGRPYLYEDLAPLCLHFLESQPLASHLTRLVTQTTYQWCDDEDEDEQRDYCQDRLKKDFGHIAALTALRSLSFEAFYHVAGFGAFEQLAGLTALQELDLGQDTLLTEGVHAALQCLSHLTRLQVGSLPMDATPLVGRQLQEVHFTAHNCLGGSANYGMRKLVAPGGRVTGCSLGLYDDCGPGDSGDMNPYWPYVYGVGDALSSTVPGFSLGEGGLLKLRCNVPDSGAGVQRFLRFKASFRIWEFMDPFALRVMGLQKLQLEEFDLSAKDMRELGSSDVGRRIKTLRLLNCRATPEALLVLAPPSPNAPSSASSASAQLATVFFSTSSASPLFAMTMLPSVTLRSTVPVYFPRLERLEIVWCHGPHEPWLPALEQLCYAWPARLQGAPRQLHLHLAVPAALLDSARSMAGRVMAPRNPLAPPPKVEQPAVPENPPPKPEPASAPAAVAATPQLEGEGAQPPPELSRALEAEEKLREDDNGSALWSGGAAALCMLLLGPVVAAWLLGAAALWATLGVGYLGAAWLAARLRRSVLPPAPASAEASVAGLVAPGGAESGTVEAGEGTAGVGAEGGEERGAEPPPEAPGASEAAPTGEGGGDPAPDVAPAAASLPTGAEALLLASSTAAASSSSAAPQPQQQQQQEVAQARIYILHQLAQQLAQGLQRVDLAPAAAPSPAAAPAPEASLAAPAAAPPAAAPTPMFTFGAAAWDPAAPAASSSSAARPLFDFTFSSPVPPPPPPPARGLPFGGILPAAPPFGGGAAPPAPGAGPSADAWAAALAAAAPLAFTADLPAAGSKRGATENGAGRGSGAAGGGSGGQAAGVGQGAAAAPWAAASTRRRRVTAARRAQGEAGAPGGEAVLVPSPVTVSLTTYVEERDIYEHDRWRGYSSLHHYTGFTGVRASWGMEDYYGYGDWGCECCG